MILSTIKSNSDLKEYLTSHGMADVDFLAKDAGLYDAKFEFVYDEEKRTLNVSVKAKAPAFIDNLTMLEETLRYALYFAETFNFKFESERKIIQLRNDLVDEFQQHFNEKGILGEVPTDFFEIKKEKKELETRLNKFERYSKIQEQKCEEEVLSAKLNIIDNLRSILTKEDLELLAETMIEE